MKGSIIFGTGGIRAKMGEGPDCINPPLIRKATQALAQILKKRETKQQRVFIGYDVRHLSKEFAIETARVLAGFGIEALITKEVCPTPLTSFGARTYGCSAAVMITASHNPPEYNGYKVFNRDGAQLVSPMDQEMIDEMGQVESIEQAPPDDPAIIWVGEEIDMLYLKRLFSHPLLQNRSAKSLHITYTNLHGTGLRLIPKALTQAGFHHFSLVEQEAPFDPDFTHTPSPNPEEATALKRGTKQLLREKGDLLFATDPDADRLGLVLRHEERAIRLNGNEIAALCLDHLAKNQKGVFIKTIVTSELTKRIAEYHQIECIETLTGFKYIAEQIALLEKKSPPLPFLFGAEESHGYLFSDFVRDKDAIQISVLLAMIAEEQKKRSRTLLHALYDLYFTHGLYRQHLETYSFEKQGMHAMDSFMTALRKTPPTSATRQVDFLNQTTGLPSSNVLLFWLDDETKIVVRPSGTEPKLKIYLEVMQKIDQPIEQSISAADARLKYLSSSFKKEHIDRL